jgi:hypothetical protein
MIHHAGVRFMLLIKDESRCACISVVLMYVIWHSCSTLEVHVTVKT